MNNLKPESRQQQAGRQADIGHRYVLNIFSCLLADICELSRVAICPPDDITYDWVLKEAPKLDKALLMWLEGSGELPEFPEWLLPLWNSFRSSMDPNTLRLIRQVLLFCYKIEIEPTYEQLEDAQKAFEETDDSIGIWNQHFAGSDSQVLTSSARQIIGRIICGINWADILPSHGPGAVYPPAKPWEKSKVSTVYTTIDNKYPIADNFVCLPNYWDDVLVKGDKSLRSADDIVARLVAVPKDSRGPRLICVHPKEAIWIQQGCRAILERAITSKKSEAHGRIAFNDQTINGGLALSASRDREFVTLDLKEASDRISCELVRSLFGEYAYSWLSCSRATKVRLLDDRVISLRKWAPMGNALCFPVQSLIFYALVRSGIRCRYGINCNDVYVFGDDIIFPSKYYDGAVSSLIRMGLVPNPSKTFRRGFFRESCGVDAFKGVDVTPHRLRKTDASTVSGSFSMCTLAKAMYMDAFYHTADVLYRCVSMEFGPLPLGNNPDAQGLYRYINVGWDSLMHYATPVRYDRRWQKYQTPCLLVGGTTISISNGAWWHLQDSLLRLEHSSSAVSDRGLEYAVPHRVRSKRGWTDVLMTSEPESALRNRALVARQDAWFREVDSGEA
jgi:hypothetical protein